MLDKAVQYYHTVRYLRPWQVVGRLVAITRRRLPGFGLPEPPAGLHGGLQPFRQFLRHDPWNSREDILAGTFRFLDVRRKLGRPVEWQAEGMPLLWKYNLHYFKYLPLLAHDEQVTLCREWIKANPPGRTTGWQPYPTSQRIVNWCKAGFKDSALLESLYLQAAYLYRNLETYVLGNHYLENARALVFAGVNFGGQGEAAAWLEKGRQIIRSETPEQILADGGSFE